MYNKPNPVAFRVGLSLLDEIGEVEITDRLVEELNKRLKSRLAAAELNINSVYICADSYGNEKRLSVRFGQPGVPNKNKGVIFYDDWANGKLE